MRTRREYNAGLQFSPKIVGPGARHEVELGLDAAILQLLIRRLRAQVLPAVDVGRYPLQQPQVALVSAGYLQRHHATAPKSYHRKLAGLSKEGETCSHADEPEPRPEVRVILEGSDEVGKWHVCCCKEAEYQIVA